MIRAGAGAGKTRTLVMTLIEFIKDHRRRHQRDPRIVVTTFTRKATQEVKERLLKEALSQGDDEVFRFLSHRSKAHISTIHGILSVLLSRFIDRMGWPNDFRIEGGAGLRRLQRKVLKQCLLQGENLELREFYSFDELLTILLQYREKHALYPGMRPLTIKELRDEARREAHALVVDGQAIATRIEACEPTDSWMKWVDRLRSLPPVPDGDEEFELFVNRVEELGVDLRKAPRTGKNPKVDEVTNEIYSEYVENRWKIWTRSEANHIYRPSFWCEHERLAKLLRDLAESWIPAVESEMQERGWVSMADLEILGLRLAQRHPDLLRSFAMEWDYWMVDEFQDTSPVQVELMKHLIADRPHFVVGDPQQSIYFFRGARSQVFEEKFAEFKRSGALTDVFEANRRSRAPVLRFINEFFDPHSGFSPMEPACDKEAMADDVPAVEYRPVAPGDGFDAVLERIQELADMGEPLESIAVLSRKNEDLKEIQRRAHRVGLPIQLHSASGFSDRREVLDSMAFLRFLGNPYDNRNLILLLRSPWFFTTDAEIAELVRRGGKFLWLTLRSRSSSGVPPAAVSLGAYLDNVDLVGYGHSLRNFYRESGIVDRAARMDPSGRREANLWKLLNRLEAAQLQPGFSLLGFLAGQSKSSSTEEGGDDGDAVPVVEPRRAHLMTVHASKGLEFRHVIIPQMHQKRNSERTHAWMLDDQTGIWTVGVPGPEGARMSTSLASRVRAMNDHHVERESLRLLYVALTRAQQTISLVWEKDDQAKSPNGSSSSWGALLPKDLKDGVHQGDGYVYRCRSGVPEVRKLGIAMTPKIEAPALWSECNESTPRARSATSMGSSASGVLEKTPDQAVRGLRIAQRGTEAHRLFEALKYVPYERVLEMTTDQEMRNAILWVRELHDPPLMSLIDSGHVEWGYTAVDDGGTWRSGQIDLWSLYDDKLWVVDYKTGSTEHVEKAYRQMALYAWALQRTRRASLDLPVELVAVFPMEEKTLRRSFRRLRDLEEIWTEAFAERP